MVGEPLGIMDGALVGAIEGTTLGITVGCHDGIKVGGKLGNAVVVSIDGRAVGVAVDKVVDIGEGLRDFRNEGSALRKLDGPTNGDMVGVAVGKFVVGIMEEGVEEGSSLGIMVDPNDGINEGYQDGDNVGVSDGAVLVGDPVGKELGTLVGSEDGDFVVGAIVGYSDGLDGNSLDIELVAVEGGEVGATVGSLDGCSELGAIVVDIEGSTVG